MQIGLFFNSLICFFVVGFTFFTAWYIYQNNKNNLVDAAYAGFWLFCGCTWLFVGMALVFFSLGFKQVDILINQYFVQTVIYAQIICGSYYVTFRLFRNQRFAKNIFLLFLILSAISLSFTFQKGGVVLSQSSYYSTEYKINQISWLMFQAMFALIILGILFDNIRNLYYRWQRKELFEIKYFLANSAGIVYGIVGYVDQQGDTTAGVIVVLRMLIIFCAQTAYFAYNNKE
jgi:hypothetical protein